MLLLAYLMTRSEPFEEASIRVLAPARPGDSADRAKTELARMLDDVRIEASAEIIVDPGPASVVAHSRDAAVVFQPFRLERSAIRNQFGGPLEETFAGLGCTVLALARQELDLDAEPETGRRAQLAEAIDAARRAGKLAAEAEAESERAATASLEARRRLDEARAEGRDDEEALTELADAAQAADGAAEKSRRRAIRARVKADTAAAEAAALEAELAGRKPETNGSSPERRAARTTSTPVPGAEGEDR